MIRLLKYLKPYSFFILAAIIMLFIQANADLALPDYMSRIVNIGIQQGGVETAVPSIIRQSRLKQALVFLNEADRERVLSSYDVVDPNTAGNSMTVNNQEIQIQESVFILKTTDAGEMDWLNGTMSKALAAVTGLEQMLANPEQAAQMAQSMGMNLSQLPPGMDIYQLLGSLPPEQRATLDSALEQQFANLGENMLVQTAIRSVKTEYETLGLDPGVLQNQYILRTGAIMLLVSLVSVICAIVVGWIASRTSAGFARDVRKAVFEKVESFSSTEFDKFSTASLITRSTNDVTQVSMLVLMMVRMFFFAPIMGVGGIIRAMDKGSSMWWTIALAVVILLILVTVVFTIAIPKFKLIQKLVDRLNLVMRENLSGIMVIRAFNMQQHEEERFDRANQDLTGNILFINRVMASMFPFMMVIMNGISLLIIWVGSHQVAQSNMQVGDMMAFMQYAMQIVMSFLMMSIMFINLPRAAVSGDRIAEVLEIKPMIKDPEEPAEFPQPVRGLVEFRNVSFRYPDADENVICNVSFTAHPGKTTAIIGSTGSGKSTVINLIPRFFDVTEGQILIDGVDIRSVSQHDLRQQIGYIPQKSTLFSGTIESNLRFGDENASDELLNQAISIAQAGEFVYANQEGLAAEISQGGTNVSGGQKQRLSIARALVKQAPIYIFDDSFSALDFKTDAALRKALRDNTAQSTLIIVTQRVSTILYADQIIVLDDGMVVGIGTHAELMKSCQTYREIAMSQLSVEELS